MILKPASSKRWVRRPTRPRATASGFRTTRVRSRLATALPFVSPPQVCQDRHYGTGSGGLLTGPLLRRGALGLRDQLHDPYDLGSVASQIGPGQPLTQDDHVLVAHGR